VRSAAGRSRSRLVERARDGVDPSDATPAVAHTMAPVFEYWPQSTTVDTATTVTDAVRTVLNGIGYPARLLVARDAAEQ
jgi:predicted kinase